MRGYFSIGIDGVTKTGNMGNLIRTAHGFGAAFAFSIKPAFREAIDPIVLDALASPEALTRLINLGVEPYLVASAVLAVIAQRLVRLNCVHCSESFEASETQLRELGPYAKDLPDNLLHRGKGCEHCLGRGLYDRTALYECLEMTETVRDQVIARASASVIKQKAVEEKLMTLRMDGLQKVIRGRTTMEEVFRVTQLDMF